MRWALLAGGMVFPGVVALVDCVQREPQEFEGGAPDRAAWRWWLVVAILTSPIGVGYGILLGYYWNVVKRSATMMPSSKEDEWSNGDSE